jgi:hypothetical protein
MVGEGLGVEPVAPRRMQVARVGAGIGGRGLQDAVDHVVLAAVALPQQVVRQFMAEHGLQLRALQSLHERAREHDVRLARQEEERGVHRAVARLVERDARRDAQALHRRVAVRVQLGVGVGIEPVRIAQQVRADRRGMLLARLGGSGPAPDFGLVRLQMGGQGLLVGERGQVVEANGRRDVDHVRSARQ